LFPTVPSHLLREYCRFYIFSIKRPLFLIDDYIKI